MLASALQAVSCKAQAGQRVLGGVPQTDAEDVHLGTGSQAEVRAGGLRKKKQPLQGWLLMLGLGRHLTSLLADPEYGRLLPPGVHSEEHTGSPDPQRPPGSWRGGRLLLQASEPEP